MKGKDKEDIGGGGEGGVRQESRGIVEVRKDKRKTEKVKVRMKENKVEEVKQEDKEEKDEAGNEGGRQER